MLLSVAFFALGAVCASFAGVVVARLYTRQNMFSGRSRCDACGKPLPVLSLVPIVSYVALGGRARCCRSRLSPVSPISELVLAGLFYASYLSLGLTPALPAFLSALFLLLVLVLYDLAHQILPPTLLGLFVTTSAVVGYLETSAISDFLSVFEGAFLIGTSLALIHVLSRGRAMGLADAPLAFGLALLVGPVAVSGFLFSFWIGALVGIVLLAGRPLGSRMGVEVPFAPFLAAGFLLAYFTQWNLLAFLVGSP